MARGGKRTGTPGASYPNRSDLRAPAPAAPTGLPYGEHKQLIDAQRAVPAGPAPSPAARPPAQGVQRSIVQPGSLPWMHPTTRPNEPVQAGLASGPGPGPEALQGVGQNLGQQQPSNTKQLLSSLANQPNASSSVKELASYAQAGRV